mmetsp:Transcript_21333/g.43391  ORF Transcript_21333/g.43391 Transcript_21333/m.43391 type:complete len:211 (+) Transcript_21333:278-910(+)
MPVRHTLCDPNCARACRVGEDVEHPALVRIDDEQGFSGAFKRTRAVEAILLSHGPHELHRLPGCFGTFHGELGERVDAHECGAAMACGFCSENAGTSAFCNANLLLVDDSIRLLKVLVRVRHLGNVANRLPCSLVPGWIILLDASAFVHVPWVLFQGIVNLSHRSILMVCCRDDYQPRVRRAFSVIAVRSKRRTIFSCVLGRKDCRATID